MKDKITLLDRIVFVAYRFIERVFASTCSLAVGFLFGRWVNELSVRHKTAWDSLWQIGTLDRQENWWTWAVVVVLLLVVVLRPCLSRLHTKRDYRILFASLLDHQKSPHIVPYDGIGIRGVITLQSAPDLDNGWSYSEVTVRAGSAHFSLPRKYQEGYTRFCKDEYERLRLSNDGVKLMLIRNPTSFSDASSLELDVIKTKYSEAQYFAKRVALLAEERDSLVRLAKLDGTVGFAHTLCMQLIVVTKDDKLLLTLSSPKKDYFPCTWSCSVEEQLSIDDFTNTAPRDRIFCWARRALHEELGVVAGNYNASNLRVMSVFLETESCLNVSLCVHVILDLDSADLEALLRGMPRTDYEFSEWMFIDHQSALQEVFRPSYPYHPTSQYRLFWALLRRFGEPGIAQRYFDIRAHSGPRVYKDSEKLG